MLESAQPGMMISFRLVLCFLTLLHASDGKSRCFGFVGFRSDQGSFWDHFLLSASTVHLTEYLVQNWKGGKQGQEAFQQYIYRHFQNNDWNGKTGTYYCTLWTRKATHSLQYFYINIYKKNSVTRFSTPFYLVNKSTWPSYEILG